MHPTRAKNSYLLRAKTLISLIDHDAKLTELWTRANTKIKRVSNLKFCGNAPLGVQINWEKQKDCVSS